MMNKVIMISTGITVTILLVVAGLFGMGVFTFNKESDKLQVVATTTFLGDTVKNIGGDEISLTVLMGVGVSPHSYEPTPSDLQALDQADVIFYIGQYAEENLVPILREKTNAYELFTYLPKDKLLTSPIAPDESDPHIWQSPKMWKYIVQGINKILDEQDPTHAAIYDSNTQTYLQALDSLDSYITTQVNKIPLAQRVLVTYHNAYRYFGRDYNFTTRALLGISTNDQTGIQEIQELAEFMKNNSIYVIFDETENPSDQSQALIEAAADIGWNITIGGELYAGSLGASGSPQDTYIKMIRYNVDTIVTAILQFIEQEILAHN